MCESQCILCNHVTLSFLFLFPPISSPFSHFLLFSTPPGFLFFFSSLPFFSPTLSSFFHPTSFSFPLYSSILPYFSLRSPPPFSLLLLFSPLPSPPLSSPSSPLFPTLLPLSPPTGNRRPRARDPPEAT